MEAMNQYTTLLAHIAELQAQADALREEGQAEAITQIKGLMTDFGITAADLGLTLLPPKAAKRVRIPGVAKFKDPNSHKTWTGKGAAPVWLVGNQADYLISA